MEAWVVTLGVLGFVLRWGKSGGTRTYMGFGPNLFTMFQKKKGNLHVNKDDVDLYTDEKDTYIVVNIKMVGGFNKSGSEDDVVICMG